MSPSSVSVSAVLVVLVVIGGGRVCDGGGGGGGGEQAVDGLDWRRVCAVSGALRRTATTFEASGGRRVAHGWCAAGWKRRWPAWGAGDPNSGVTSVAGYDLTAHCAHSGGIDADFMTLSQKICMMVSSCLIHAQRTPPIKNAVASALVAVRAYLVIHHRAPDTCIIYMSTVSMGVVPFSFATRVRTFVFPFSLKTPQTSVQRTHNSSYLLVMRMPRCSTFAPCLGL